MRFDDPTEVELLQACRIEAGKKHVENKEDVDFTLLKSVHLILTLRLVAHVVENEGTTCHGAARDRIKRRRFGRSFGKFRRLLL